MKKLLKKLTVAVLSVSCLFGAVACSSTVKGGSKIQVMTVTFDIDGTEKSVDFELYLNYAPGTIDHVKYLIGKGYYDGTLVSNVNKQIEFGEYEEGRVSKYTDKAKLSYVSAIKDYATADKTNGSSGTIKRYVDEEGKINENYAINGEFELNGIKGNKLDFSNGALVLKREVGTESGDRSYDDTARATLAVTFSSNTYYDDTRAFAIIGKIKNSDDVTELKKLVGDDYTKDDGNTEYCYKGEYYMLKSDGKYYSLDDKGDYTVELDDESEIVEEFKSSETSKYLEIVPAKTIIVKSIKLGK